MAPDKPDSQTNPPTNQQNQPTGQGQPNQGTRATGKDRPRDVPVSREQGRATTGLERSQRVLPSVFAPPGALAGLFMANPFEFMHRITEEMDTWLDNITGRGNLSTRGERGTELMRGGLGRLGWIPQVETFRRGNDLIVRADVPGVQKQDFDVRVEDGALIVSGERKQEQEEETREGGFRSERSYGSFYRAIALPEGVSEDQISASYRDGVLEVKVPIPVTQETKGKKIEIR